MRGIYYVAGLAVLGTALAGGWVALALAQSKLPPPSGQPETAPPAQPVPAPNPASLPMTSGVSGGVEAKPVAYGVPASEAKTAPGGAEESEQANGPGVTEGNTTGRQEPAVSVEWIGPPVTKLGRPADFTVAIRNVCNIAVQQVMVRVRIPSGMSVNTTEPKAIAEGNVLMWELGTMMPKQEKNLQIRMVPDGKGGVRCQAWVTFTGSSIMPIKVTEPKLLLKAQAPERVMVGDAATFVLTVTNPGDGPAEQVKIHADLSDGLEHVRGKKVDYEIGNLAAGESRSVQLICATKGGGVQTCEAVAEADDLRSQDKAAVNVIMPRIELEATGPKLRYLDRKATYSFKVTNPGDAPATNVSVADVIPAGFKFSTATDGGRHDFSTRTVSWFLGELGAGQTKEVKLEVVAINPGEFHHKASAQAARGLKDEKEITTKVEGLSAIMLEAVDTEDPIEVGSETSYEIRITNTGSKTETELKLVCVLPEQMQFKSATGPARFHEQGKELIFESIPKLAPRADAIFRVNVKATAAGSVRFKAQITSTGLLEPSVKIESTRIYDD